MVVSFSFLWSTGQMSGGLLYCALIDCTKTMHTGWNVSISLIICVNFDGKTLFRNLYQYSFDSFCILPE